jgi:hypothetical protein
LRSAAFVLGVAVVVVLAQNYAVQAYFPRLARVNADFSPAYLQRELRGMSAAPPQVVFLGDSVLWGFALEPRQTAVSILRARGCDCRNLAFKAGSPPNYYALVRLMEHAGVHPKLVVLEVNQGVLTKANRAYATLHPALAELAAPLLSDGDRTALGVPAPGGFTAALDRIASGAWGLYAMRADIKELLDPAPDAVPAKPPAADTFFAEYDLTPLGESNVGVRYLEKTADALRADGTPVLAIMTPTNHDLLHDYIDGPEYRANLSYLERLLESRGARVADLDAAFRGRDFFDNAHLKPAAQVRLATMIAREFPR